MIVLRVVAALVGAMLLTGCASASYVTVKPSNTPCTAEVPSTDFLLGVALSGGGSRAALFAEASLEALAQLRTVDGVSAIEKIDYNGIMATTLVIAAIFVVMNLIVDILYLFLDPRISYA